MSRLLILFLIVVVETGTPFAQFGVDAFESPFNHGNEKHCAFAEKWSAYMTDLKTVNSETPSVLHIQMDYDRKLQALLNFTGSKTPVSKVVIDYCKDMFYFVPTNYPEKCYKVPISLPLIRRIPDDAEYLGSNYMGPIGAGQLDYDGWRIRASKGKAHVVYTIAVSKEGCVPLVEGEAFPENPAQNQLYMFAGFQPKLTDPSAFDLPDSCFK